MDPRRLLQVVITCLSVSVFHFLLHFVNSNIQYVKKDRSEGCFALIFVKSRNIYDISTQNCIAVFFQWRFSGFQQGGIDKKIKKKINPPPLPLLMGGGGLNRLRFLL